MKNLLAITSKTILPLQKKNCFFLAFIGILISLIFAACKSDIVANTSANHFTFQADDSIYLNTLPADIYLSFGKSIYIKNGAVILKFLDVLENTSANTTVRLEITYSSGSNEFIVLSTAGTQQTYDLTNGYPYEIQLIEFSGQQIRFTFNQYATL